MNFIVIFGILLILGFLIWLIYYKTRKEREHQIIQYYPNGALKTIHHYKGDVLMIKEVFDEKSELKIVYKYYGIFLNEIVRLRKNLYEYHYCINKDPGEDNYFASNEYSRLVTYNYREGLFPDSLLELFSSYSKAKALEILKRDSAFFRFINPEFQEDKSFILSALEFNGDIITEIETSSTLEDAELFIAALVSKKPYLDTRVYSFFDEEISMSYHFGDEDNDLSTHFEGILVNIKNALMEYFFNKSDIFISRIFKNYGVPNQEIKDEFIKWYMSLNDDDAFRFNITLIDEINACNELNALKAFAFYDGDHYFNRWENADFILKNKLVLNRIMNLEELKSKAKEIFFEKNIELLNNGKEYLFQKINRNIKKINYFSYFLFAFLLMGIIYGLTNDQWMLNHIWVLFISAISSGILADALTKALQRGDLGNFISKKKVLKKLQKQYTDKVEILDIMSGGEKSAYLTQYIDSLLLEDEVFQAELQRVNPEIDKYKQDLIYLSYEKIYRTIYNIGLSQLNDDDLIKYYYTIKVHHCIDIDFSEIILVRIEKLTHDIEYMTREVSQKGKFIAIACQELKDNEAFCLKAIANDAEAFEFVSDRLKDNEIVVRAAVEKCGFLIQLASDRLQNMKEIALLAVQQDIYSFEYLTPKWKTEWEIFELVYIGDKDYSFSCLNSNEKMERLQQMMSNPKYTEVEDKDSLIREQLQSLLFSYSIEDFFQKIASGYYEEVGLDEIPSGYENDKTVVLAAVKVDGLLLEKASNHLKGDFDVVMAAVIQDGDAIEFASKTLKKNKEIINAAVKSNGCALEFVTCNNYKILKIALESDPACIQYINFDNINFGFLINEDYGIQKLVKMSLKEDCGYNLQYAPNYYQNKKSIVRLALENNGSLEHASLRLRNHKKTVQFAVEHNPANFQFASIRLRRDKDFVKWCVEIDYRTFKYASYQLKSDIDFVKSLIPIDWRIIVHASIPVINDPELVKYAFSKYKRKDFLEIINDIHYF